MNSTLITKEPFDEKQSLKTIKSAIATSRKTLMDDGILLICWGLALSISNFWQYYKEANLTAWWMRNFMNFFQIASGIAVIGLTIYFIFFRKKRVTTFTATSTRFVWIGIIVAHNLNVIITKNILTEVNFELLHPLQMVLIGFALFVTGGIYRYYILSICGAIMWSAAAIVVNFELDIQLLIRAIADFICFVVPGILMYTASKK